MKFEDITEEMFAQYVDVQLSGKTNMYDLTMVEVLGGPSPKITRAIQDNYEKLSREYPDVISESEKEHRSNESSYDYEDDDENSY